MCLYISDTNCMSAHQQRMTKIKNKKDVSANFMYYGLFIMLN